MAFSKSFIAIIFLLNLTPAPKIEPQRVKIMAVGDNLIHNSVLRAANLGKNKYNFEYLYEPMRKTINDFDIKIINQETILVKEPKNYTAKFPFFASPYAVGEALIKSGFNVIAQANNHSMDKGERGILDSVEFWEKYPEITMLGIYKNLDDFNKITIRETKGIKIAYLNYTYGLNGFQVPKKKPYLVKTLFKQDLVLEELQRARKLADFVIVLVHWGVEYSHKPSPYQRKWAELFASNGADLIIGSHPHTVEPLEIIKNQEGKEVPCYFSLGNFISGQVEIPRILGAMAEVELLKDKENIKIVSSKIKPLITHRDAKTRKYQAYLLEDYNNNLAKKHYLYQRGKKFSKESLEKLFNKIIN